MSTQTQAPIEAEHARACDDYTAVMRECRQLENQLWHVDGQYTTAKRERRALRERLAMAKARRALLGQRVSELGRLIEEAEGTR